MLKKLSVRAGLMVSGVFSLALLVPANAKPPVKAQRANTHLASVTMAPNAEKGFEKALLGIRILQSYKVALQKLGQPTRILRADEYMEIQYDYDAKGKATGGIADIVSGGDLKDASGAAPPPPAPAPGDSGDGSTDPTAANGASAPAAPAGGLNGTAQEKPVETFGQAGGYIWIYLFKATKKAYVIIFNGDGRAMVIAEMGQGIGSPTKRNINLGAPLNEVYARYGWPDSVEETKEGMQLFYDIKHHCQFDVVNNKVQTVVVMLSEGMVIRRVKSHNGGGGGNGGPGGGGSNGGNGQQGAQDPQGRPHTGGGGG